MKSAEALYDHTLQRMERAVHNLTQRVPPPRAVPFKDGFVFRHVERNIHQAIVQKLARMVSTLHASRLLMEHGFVQEQATLQRVLDELQEDVTFLCHGAAMTELPKLHEEFLEAFFEEEFDADSAIESTQKRPMIPRRRIRAWIAAAEGAGVDPSRGVELFRTISKAYSGYVHAASPHIMDIYLGDPPRFQMAGVLGTPRHQDHREDIWNYFYRGILAFGGAAKAFGDEQMFLDVRAYSIQFAEANGKNYRSNAT